VGDGNGAKGDTRGNARVAVLEARRESELASLVRRHGGEPICVPALREVERDCVGEVRAAIEILAGPRAIVVLATGVGLDRWLAVAAGLQSDVPQQGKRDELRRGLARATVVCRGPKPVAVLKREGLRVHLRAEPPHTTVELVTALASLDVEARDVIYVHDGGGLRTVPEVLIGRGAHVVEIQPYEWALPENLEPLRELVRLLRAGGVDALAITTQVQAKHLFAVAVSMGAEETLRVALRERVIVAAVGPTCARVLTELGAPPHVMPVQSKMGPLVLALMERLGSRSPQPG
jgi:uroporphyrinogen-III synthase